MPGGIWKRAAVLTACALASLVVLGGVAVPRETLAAAQPYLNPLNYGSPASPLSIVPSDMDVQIHRRDPSDAMEPMDAGHGTDCSAPPATHTIDTLAQGVFACKNHLMTAIGDSGYGEIALTPGYMADWSTGTATITFDVSTLQFNDSDWIELWITPFADNMNLPFEDQIIDFQGPPKNAIVFSLNKSGLMGTNSGDVSIFQNYVQGNTLPKLACLATGDPQCISPTGYTSVVPPSGVTRVEYEIDISSSHIKFGLPGIVNWTDTNVSVPFSQGVVQLVHHSYNPLKHAPGTGIDTYHWSNLAISNAVPFTIINGAERSINAGTSSAIHFAAPAPTGSFLRFSALGTLSISWDGGATYHPAVLQGPETHIEHFASYMTPIPAGVQTIMISGQDNAYGQSWWVRDPAIWSLTAGGMPPPSVAPGPYNPVAPTRILDTRTGTGGVPVAPLGGGAALNVHITGQGPVPAVGVSAVVLNVTATDTTAASFLTVWPAGESRPTASNLNWVAGETVPNLVEVALGQNGQVSIYNAVGSVDVVFDVAGYVSTPTATPSAFGLYNPVVPNRVLDTRNGMGGVPAGRVGQGQTINVTLAGTSSIPSSGVAAVVLNVTATNASAASFLTVFPTGSARPLASNLNFVAGQTVPNRVIVKLGGGGEVSFYNAVGSVDVVADVAGWFTDGTTAAGGSLFEGLTPARILDTRITHNSIGAGATLALTVAGAGGVPLMSGSAPPKAVVLNVTVTNPSAPSFLTVWPDGAAQPLASDLNFVAGQTVANLVIVKLGASGSIDIFNSVGSADVVVDVVGWFG